MKGKEEFFPGKLLAHIPLNKSRLRVALFSISIATSLIILLAFTSSIILLLKDAQFSFLQLETHAPLSALPLLLTGIAALCFQLVIRPKPLNLFKAFIVSAAFTLWGIDQLLPAGTIATTLGDVVIVLYVVDLGWMMLDRLKLRYKHISVHNMNSSQKEKL